MSPEQTVLDPHCPAKDWWTLARQYPAHARFSPLFDVLTLEDPQRWIEMERENLHQWIPQCALSLLTLREQREFLLLIRRRIRWHPMINIAPFAAWAEHYLSNEASLLFLDNMGGHRAADELREQFAAHWHQEQLLFQLRPEMEALRHRQEVQRFFAVQAIFVASPEKTLALSTLYLIQNRWAPTESDRAEIQRELELQWSELLPRLEPRIVYTPDDESED